MSNKVQEKVSKSLVLGDDMKGNGDQYCLVFYVLIQPPPSITVECGWGVKWEFITLFFLFVNTLSPHDTHTG